MEARGGVHAPSRGEARGFSLAVPRDQTVVERAKASESYSYLAHVAKAQEMYRASTGVYADSLQKLSINAPAPKHFSVGQPTSIDWQARWSLRLTREGASSGFGAYTVSFSEKGFDAARSSIPTALSPTGQGGGQEVSTSSSGGSGGFSSTSGGSSAGESGGGPQGNNGVGNGDGGGRSGNRGGGGPR